MVTKLCTKKYRVVLGVVDGAGFKYNRDRKAWEIYTPETRTAHWCVAVDTATFVESFVKYNWLRKHQAR